MLKKNADIVIYFIKIHQLMTEESLSDYLSLITNQKQEQINRLKNIHDRKMKYCSEIFIKCILSKLLNIPNTCIKFEKNAFGKVSIKDHFQLHFNISYSKC